MQNSARMAGAGWAAWILMLMGGLATAEATVLPDDAIQAQVVEGANLARSLMTFVADDYAFSGKATAAYDGGSGKYVDSIAVKNGRIDIVYGKLAHASIAAKTLSITPYLNANQNIIWRCGNQPKPPGLRLLKGASYQASSVDNALAVQACVNVDSAPNIASYRGDVIRGHIAGGIGLAAGAKTSVSEYYFNGAQDLSGLAQWFNAKNNNRGEVSQYVYSLQVDAASGSIIITYDPKAFINSGIQAGANTVVLTPYVYVNGSPVQLGTAMAMQQSGSVDWSCASATSVLATSRGLPPVVNGTLPAKYAPAYCR